VAPSSYVGLTSLWFPDVLGLEASLRPPPPCSGSDSCDSCRQLGQPPPSYTKLFLEDSPPSYKDAVTGELSEVAAAVYCAEQVQAATAVSYEEQVGAQALTAVSYAEQVETQAATAVCSQEQVDVKAATAAYSEGQAVVQAVTDGGTEEQPGELTAEAVSAKE